jgi:hypothetical protein
MAGVERQGQITVAVFAHPSTHDDLEWAARTRRRRTSTYRAVLLRHVAIELRQYIAQRPPPTDELGAINRWISALEAEATVLQAAADTRRFVPREVQ